MLSNHKNRKSRKKYNLIDYAEFNRFSTQSGVANPAQDSPGDTADDEIIETVLGQTYDPEGYTVESYDGYDGFDEEQEEEDDSSVISSSRPDPIRDLDKSSSTH